MTHQVIAREYQRRLAACPGHPDWGWSFMYTPEAAITSARAMLVGLNPGGEQIGEPGQWDYKTGVNAYIDESWNGRAAGQAPLQQQVARLFASAGLDVGDVFAANLVPFRSPTWAKLPEAEQALDWSLRTLWPQVLDSSSARLFMSLGKRPGREVAKLLKAVPIDRHHVSWGNQSIEEFESADGRVVLAMPHLSRFQIFGRTTGTAEKVVSAAASRAFAAA